MMEYEVLQIFIQKRRPLKPSEIAEALKVKKYAIYPSLRQLEQAGFIKHFSPGRYKLKIPPQMLIDPYNFY